MLTLHRLANIIDQYWPALARVALQYWTNIISQYMENISHKYFADVDVALPRQYC